MLIAFFLVIFFVCVAMMWNEGLWSNAITLVNVVVGALIATNYFEPLAAMFDKSMPSYTYLWDFLAIWLLFALSCGLMRVATDQISKNRVRFKMPVEYAGRIFFAAWVGWVMILFTCMTLHVAPIPRNSFGGAFQETPTSGNFLGMAPGRQWLAFMQSRSRGPTEAVSRGPLVRREPREFDPKSEFILKYGQRRKEFEQEPEYRVR